MNTSRLGMAGIAAAASLMAFLSIPSEFAAFRTNLAAPSAQATTLASMQDQAPLPASVQGRQYLLETCLELQSSREIRLMSRGVKDGAREACRAISDRAMEAAPAYALGYLVSAQVSGNNDEIDSLLAALGQAQFRAPTEGWQASWRVNVMMRFADAAAYSSTESFEADILLMAQGNGTIEALARYYKAYPQWQGIVADIVERAEPKHKKRFLNAVRRVQRARG